MNSKIIDRKVCRFSPLSADVIAKAQAGEATIELHDSCLQDIPAFAALEQAARSVSLEPWLGDRKPVLRVSASRSAAFFGSKW